MGAGVAGLQAIATARRLGAIVSATDVRAAAKEHVESLGASFITVDETAARSAETAEGYAREMGEDFQRRQREKISEVLKRTDVVICTALIPGRKAPVLLTEAMVAELAPGSVIVDLAVEAGGNVEGSRPGELVTTPNGVKIIGHVNMPSRIPVDASQLYARNLWNFLTLLVDKDGKLKIDTADEIIKATLLTENGAVVNPALLPPAVADARAAKQLTEKRWRTPSPWPSGPARPPARPARSRTTSTLLAQQLALQAPPAATAGTPFVFELTVFVLAVFVGYHVVWRVTPALHSPLMSVTNAISSVIIVGALIAAGPLGLSFAKIIGLRRGNPGRGQYLRRLYRYPAHAPDVPEKAIAGLVVSESLSALCYLIASICFIMALRGLSSPETARTGNIYGIAGMVIAVVTTLVTPHVVSFWLIIVGILIGGAIGTYDRAAHSDDGTAAAGRGVSQPRRPCRRLRRRRRLHLSRSLRDRGARLDPPQQPGRDGDRHGDRCDHLHRLGRRLRQVAGSGHRPAAPLHRPTSVERRARGIAGAADHPVRLDRDGGRRSG